MAQLIDVSGVKRFEGTITGAGVPPPVWGDYGGNPVTIADGASASLTWDTLNAGTPLLDLSTPAAPVFLAGGWYDVQAQVGVSGLTAAGFALVVIGTPNSGVGSPNRGYINAVQVADELSIFPFAVVYVRALLFAAAGDNFGLSADSHDGAASRDFSLQDALIVKLA